MTQHCHPRLPSPSAVALAATRPSIDRRSNALRLFGRALVASGVIIAALAASSMPAGADIGPIDLPEHWGVAPRDVLVEPAPYPMNRARLVTRELTGAVAPNFVVAGPPYAREPVTATRDSRRSMAANLGAPQFLPQVVTLPQSLALPPGATLYGANVDLYDLYLSGPRAHARVGSTLVRFDPFARSTPGELHQVVVARRIWLNEHGYVQRARILQRGVPSSRIVVMASGRDDDAAALEARSRSGDDRPEPRATIRIHRKPVTAPLQATRPAEDGGQRAEATSG